jgi:hypothetical protein
VFSLELDQLSPVEAGRRCGEALRASLAKAGIEPVP